MIHLVNDAVQKKGGNYSTKSTNKEACKMSMSEFQQYLLEKGGGVDSETAIYPQMKNLMYKIRNFNFNMHTKCDID